MVKFLKKIYQPLYSEEELESMLLKRYGIITDYEINKKEEEKLFEALKEVEGFMDYLKNTIAKDITRYFTAQKEQHDVIKGAFARTLYFKNLLVGKKKEKKTKLDGIRYGK